MNLPIPPLMPQSRQNLSAENVTVTEDTLSVDLSDGRTILVPLAWFPRLLHATPEERNHWKLIGKGHGIHWEDIDEDNQVQNGETIRCRTKSACY